MTHCPCCSNTLLRHIQHHQVYWFCRNCWQSMPALEGPEDSFSQNSLENALALAKQRRLSAKFG